MLNSKPLHCSQTESSQGEAFSSPLFPVTILANTPQANGYVLLCLAIPPEIPLLENNYLLFIKLDNILPVMRVNPAQQTLDVLCSANAALYQIGTQYVATLLHKPFIVFQSPITLLIAENNYIASLVFLVNRLRVQQQAQTMVCFLTAEAAFPFKPRPSQIFLPAMPDGVIAAMPLLDDWGVVSRLAHEDDLVGCYAGHIVALIRHYLTTQAPENISIQAIVSPTRARAIHALIDEYPIQAIHTTVIDSV
ncbi:hypothetical protein [Beggiatoa leptomitoformis]|uniref:Uncharacterized protein n=1 Tax=Beggiatoa leptomitoformis TaxID=288004 RepID=A0A2N9YBQ7_9GAMM|nr:hypothetical protein [Beggiatoa leptomitoformis]AUI67903.1 hypothetical protein BLE401_03750 [Beggiatoa leptomitoformis]QGX03490.1 hypothetical protein AL038_18340 [Beggiatoa leptomitoformis]